MSIHGPINGVKISRMSGFNPRYMNLSQYLPPPFSAIDDPHKVVKVIASDGKSAETREISYTNCKVIGNGSFGVVFQARLVGSQKENDDIAIKKVLQDKRFKVILFLYVFVTTNSLPVRTASCK